MTKEPRMHNRDRRVSSISGSGKTGRLYAKEWNWTTLTICTKINSKCIKDLNLRPKIMKLLEENIGCKIFGTGLGNEFFNTTLKAQATKAKVNK